MAVAFVSVTERETGTPEPETVERPPGEGHAQPRVPARARGRMVAALAAITQRVQDRRVAAVLVKRVDPYAGVLTDEEAVAPTGRDGWWTVGPLPPKQQWAAFVGKLHAADHWLVWLVMALVAGSACAVGIAGAGVTWLSQHLGATAIGGVALALWWAAATTGGAP